MQLADTLRKTKFTWEDGGLFFCSAEEGARQALQEYPAGKVLFVTDKSALGAFRNLYTPRGVNAVLDTKDALPLFSMPDEVALVLAAGGGNTLAAARYFAEVRRANVVLFPTEAMLDGTYEREAELVIGGTHARVRLADGRSYCDLSLLKPNFAAGYAGLLLARLALLEGRALRCFRGKEERTDEEERAYAELSDLSELSGKDVLNKSAVLAGCMRRGMACGEGKVLAAALGHDGAWRAFLQLSALYAAFFQQGKPLLFVPDYRRRAQEAGVSYAGQSLPTQREYAFRACALERKRAAFFAEADMLCRRTGEYRKNLFSLSGRAFGGAGSLEELRKLPEHSNGLSAIIRDFGLMDW